MKMEIIHPEIKVPDLMTHIHQELSRYQAATALPPTCGPRPGHPAIWELIAAQLDRAERHAYMGRSVPEMKRFRRLTRWLGQKIARAFLLLAQVITKGQREYNVATVQAVRDLTDLVRNLDQFQRESHQHLEQVRQENCEGLEVARGQQHATLRAHETTLQRQETELHDQGAALQRLEADLSDQGAALQRLEGQWRELAAALEKQTGEGLDQERSLREQATALYNLEVAGRDRQALLERQATMIQNQELVLQEQTLLLQQQEAVLRDKDARLARLEKALGQVKTDSHIQEGRVRVFLEEARRRLPGPLAEEQLEKLAREHDHWLDSLYLTFENQFRGTREEIKSRLQVYLPRLREAGGGADILDVGCGRGEWLELMREEGFPARGVDTNRIMVEECRQRGLEVVEGDALTYLRQLSDACLAAVTGFHVIEHLPWDRLLAILDETLRVLKPGGLAIFETPNPENLLVGSCTFWADPTHLKPLYPGMVGFMAEQRGFVNVEIWRLNQQRWGDDPLRLLPEAHELAPSLNPLLELAKQRFYAAPDFAVIGNKVK
jgi:O-antigen chain-terminating methyltransferase